MKPNHTARLAAAALALAWPLKSRALFGAGDIVFDPASVAQTINVLHTAQQEFDRLGSILGISTRQLDQLVGLAAAMGNPAESGSFGRVLSPDELRVLVQANPGLQNAQIGSLFDTTGQLDAFLGVPLDQWALAIESPTAFYRQILTDPAIARVGGSAGMTPASVAYAQWYSSRAPEDQANLGGRAAVDVAHLLEADWLNDSKQRRISLQALSAKAQAAESSSGSAQTLADVAHTQAQIAATTNHVLLESAAQAAGAQETALRAAGAQSELMLEQNDARRDAAQMQLNMPP
jgi:hypothetical protein